jgi:hypothetical protein
MRNPILTKMLPFTKAVLTLSSMVVTSAATAAPQPLISYFLPMPVPAGGLSKTVWGASAVGPRDPANGIEDNGANGGVSAGSETNFYWDGKILKGSDGKYHLYCVHWKYSIGFGPPSGGSTGWQTSTPMQAISDNLLGPYIYQSDITPKGHNVTALIQPDGKYAIIMGEIVPGQVWSASSPNGPWSSLGNYSTDTNGHNNCGDLSSNATFTLGSDNRYWGTSRGGCIMSSDKITGPYKLLTDSVLPDLERGDNRQAEDEVIWYSGGYYHIVWNYWDKQRAYHIMSKDGISNWTSTGAAYQGTQSPPTQYSSWLRYTDGTINNWHNMERPGVYIENGHPAAFTFAVTDTDKNTSAVNSGGSKIIVVPFNGVQFDCDNGDTASCAELTKDAGAGGTAGSSGQGGSSGGTGGAASGGTRGGSGGSLGGGGVTGTARAGADGGVGGQGGKSSGAGGAASGGSSGGLGGGGMTGSGGAGASGGVDGQGGNSSAAGGAASGGSGGSGTGGAAGGSIGTGGAGARGAKGGANASGGHAAGEATNGSGGSSTGHGGAGGSESPGCSCTIQGPGSAGKSKVGLGLLFGMGIAFAFRFKRSRDRSTPECAAV